MKTFKAKSSVKRWAVKAFGTEVFEVGTVEQDEAGLFYFKAATIKEETKSKKVYANSSSCGRPCQVVWTIAEEMGLEAKRKDVLAKCEEAGVTFYTARTQYQKYKEALRGDVK